MENELYEHYSQIELGKGIDIRTGEVKDGLLIGNFNMCENAFSVREGPLPLK